MRWALPLVLLSLLAGCTSKPGEVLEPAGTTTTAPTSTPPTATTEPTPTTSTPPTSPTPPPQPPAKPASETFNQTGSTQTASLAGNSPEGPAPLAFTVKPGASKITAILWWNATAPTDYDLKVYDPRSCGTEASADRVQCAANATGPDPGLHPDEDGQP